MKNSLIWHRGLCPITGIILFLTVPEIDFFILLEVSNMVIHSLQPFFLSLLLRYSLDYIIIYIRILTSTVSLWRKRVHMSIT